MRISLVPKDREFFKLFQESGANIARAAKLLEEMIVGWPDSGELAREILICEQEGDRITHDIIQRLNRTFVTPLDREDIYDLAVALDDIVDYTEEVADHFGLFQIEAPMDQSKKMARILAKGCALVAGALNELRGFKNLDHYWIDINSLENEGDRLERDAVASLFADGIDPMVVIRWKDIFEHLEKAIDSTERVANILENICVKNA